MASVPLDRFFIHLRSDLANHLKFFTTGRGDERGVPGEVRRYANGRLRVIVRAGEAQTLAATLVQVTDAELDLLESWLGRQVMVRDHRGRRMYAVFFQMQVTDHTTGDYDVAVSFTEYTDTDAV